jgi:hypothetical protein
MQVLSDSSLFIVVLSLKIVQSVGRTERVKRFDGIMKRSYLPLRLPSSPAKSNLFNNYRRSKLHFRNNNAGDFENYCKRQDESLRFQAFNM